MNESKAPTSGAAPLLTEKGKLPIGVVFDGKRQQDFELRPATVADNIDATMEVGADSPLTLMTGVFARQLLKLGDVPRDMLTADLVKQMHPMDFNAIEKADEDLRKKLLRDGPILDGGQPVAQSSAKPV